VPVHTKAEGSIVLTEVEPEVKAQVPFAAVLSVNIVIEGFSKRLRQFIAQYRTPTASYLLLLLTGRKAAQFTEHHIASVVSYCTLSGTLLQVDPVLRAV
jgi:hypothetical protein